MRQRLYRFLQHTLCHLLAGVAVGGLLLSPPARAEIYKFVDDNGFVTYTNIPRPGVKPEVVITDGPKPAAKIGKPAKSTASGRTTHSSTPAYFPRIDTHTQRKRDDMRRQLLEEEMSSERRNLSAAQGALNQGRRQPGADLKRLLEAVRLHEKNIEMLNKELSHIR